MLTGYHLHEVTHGLSNWVWGVDPWHERVKGVTHAALSYVFQCSTAEPVVDFDVAGCCIDECTNSNPKLGNFQ